MLESPCFEAFPPLVMSLGRSFGTGKIWLSRGGKFGGSEGLE